MDSFFKAIIVACTLMGILGAIIEIFRWGAITVSGDIGPTGF